MIPNYTATINVDNTYKPYREMNTEFDKKIAIYIGEGIASKSEVLSQYNWEGIIASDLEEAFNILIQLFNEELIIPHAIICDSHFSPIGIKNFINRLSNFKILKSIPFLIYTKKKQHVNNEFFRYLSGLDDIITEQTNVCELNDKVAFLWKFKNLNSNSIKNKPVKKANVKFYTKIDIVVKRLLDIVVSTIALIVLSPILIIIAILIKLESKGPVFYSAHRAGRNFKIFKFHKFRTMVVDAEDKLNQLSHLNQYKQEEQSDNGVFFKISNDPRITKIGAFLRNTSLDELPQLINVLKGDMSLVGNRPLPLYEACTLTTDNWAERFLAPAGLTGLWQIKKRGQKDMSVKERISLDIAYARKRSVFYDIWIMANTPTAMVQKDNV